MATREKSRIQLSDHFTYGRLFRFVLPPIVMMIFTSIYSIVDGLFVSNFDPGLPFAALNLIFPLIMILGGVGFMLGTGGTAVVAKYLGQGDRERANRVFSMLVYSTVVIGVVLAAAGILACRPVSVWLCEGEKNITAAERELLAEYCVLYGSIILAALPMFMLQNVFQGFFVTAEKPKLGLYVTVLAGCCNILLDALLVPAMGLKGAAIATAISQTVGGLVPLLYFSRKNDSLLQLGKARFEARTFWGICINGSSELMTNISSSIVSVLFNAQLMKFVGYNGVSAYGIIMYLSFIFIAVFIGYAIGSAPVIGYNYGAENKAELKNIVRKSLFLTAAVGAVMTVISFCFAGLLSGIFAAGDDVLFGLAKHGMRVYSFSFLISGINIFASSMFTALSNGGVSALISFLRTLVFQVLAVTILPIFFAVEGIWASIVVAEGLSCLVSFGLLFGLKNKYGYF